MDVALVWVVAPLSRLGCHRPSGGVRAWCGEQHGGCRRSYRGQALICEGAPHRSTSLFWGTAPVFGYSPCSGVQPQFGAQFAHPHIHLHSRPSGATSGRGLGVPQRGHSCGTPSNGNRGMSGWDFTGVCTFLGTSALSKSHSEGNRATAIPLPCREQSSSTVGSTGTGTEQGHRPHSHLLKPFLFF